MSNQVAWYTKLWIFVTGSLNDNLDAVMQSRWLAAHFEKKQQKVLAKLDQHRSELQATSRQYRREEANANAQVQRLTKSLSDKFAGASEETIKAQASLISAERKKIESYRSKAAMSAEAAKQTEAIQSQLETERNKVSTVLNHLVSVANQAAVREETNKTLAKAYDMLGSAGGLGSMSDETVKKLEYAADVAESNMEIARDKASARMSETEDQIALIEDQSGAKSDAALSDLDFIKSLKQ